MKFISASELRKIYDVYGHFYSIEYPCGNRVDCRSVLEIITKTSCLEDFNSLSDHKPDCIFIMMNPGSSSPKVDVDNYIASSKIKNLKVSYVPTKPDTTQYQVMRIMEIKKWDHIRVLNLSDLRNPKSGEFYSKFTEVESYSDGHIHSLFSNLRTNELEAKMNMKKGASVVCAWGVSDDLNPLISRCLAQIEYNCNIVGLKKKGTENKYYHPLPTLQKDKQDWIEKMSKLLK